MVGLYNHEERQGDQKETKKRFRRRSVRHPSLIYEEQQPGMPKVRADCSRPKALSVSKNKKAPITRSRDSGLQNPPNKIRKNLSFVALRPFSLLKTHNRNTNKQLAKLPRRRAWRYRRITAMHRAANLVRCEK